MIEKINLFSANHILKTEDSSGSPNENSNETQQVQDKKSENSKLEKTTFGSKLKRIFSLYKAKKINQEYAGYAIYIKDFT